MLDSGPCKHYIITTNKIIADPEGFKLGSADGGDAIYNALEYRAKILFQDSTTAVVSVNTGQIDVMLQLTVGACFEAESDSSSTTVC